ncbi:MAG TPA: hypothetical protein VGT78_00360 [Rhizomicrobium sp.]|nr:hypothetical protein [Rhizomicrobium sp.]
MAVIAHAFLLAFYKVGGFLGIGIAVLVVSLWVNRWSRVPLAAVGTSCLYGIVTAYLAAVEHHMYRILPNLSRSDVWIGLIVLNIFNGLLVAALFFLKEEVFGPWAR